MTTNSILDYMGNTPLIEIRKINPNPRVRIFAKLEYLNPGGSIKDRAAMFMIEGGERSGELTPKKTVLEATSGNTGIGLALVCAVKGYKLTLAMAETASIERQKILKARGADILLTPGHLGTDGAIEEVYRLARENPETYYVTDQFNNEENWKAHYYTTAKEIWDQTKGEVHTVIATMGTTGTLMGISRRLKELNPKVRIIGVEPYLGHKIQGLKNMKEAYCPEIYDKKRLDKKVNIEDEEAFEMTRRLAKEEGLFVGMSSGAAMAVAVQEAREMDEGILVAIFPDSGERYLSTSLFTVKEKIDLKIFNTMTRRKELLEPITPGKVSVYTCGPSVYQRISPGECRRFIFADLLCRYLEYRGYSVSHVINITDLDDNTIAGSEKHGLELSKFTEKFIDLFKKDLKFLGVKSPSAYPLASDHLDDMIKMAEKLVDKGYAYDKLRSLYFNISRFPDYGKLSGIDINKIKLGMTVDLDEYEKDNPRDFTLLKRTRLSELKRGIYVKTRWGNVRPSWHIQCAAISMKNLGETYDIHTSSRELLFPHHENEAAIAAALTGKPLAKYWMHCDRVLIEGKKPDESEIHLNLEHLVNAGYTGREIRYWLISTHYTKPITFSTHRLEQSRNALKRMDTCIYTLRNVRNGQSYPEIDQLIYDIKQGFINAMDDDLNISAALASIFSNIKKINVLISENKIDDNNAGKIIETFRNIDMVLNVFDLGNQFADPGIQKLIEKRDHARKEKNFELADRIREELQAKNIFIRDHSIDKD